MFKVTAVQALLRIAASSIVGLLQIPAHCGLQEQGFELPAWGEQDERDDSAGKQPGNPIAVDQPAAGSHSGVGAAMMHLPPADTAVLLDMAGGFSRATALGGSPGAGAGGSGASFSVSSGTMQTSSGVDAWGGASRGAAIAGSSHGRWPQALATATPTIAGQCPATSAADPQCPGQAECSTAQACCT